MQVKSKTGRQTKWQKIWQSKSEKHGVRYAVVRGYRDALDVYDAWVKDDEACQFLHGNSCWLDGVDDLDVDISSRPIRTSQCLEDEI